MTQPSGKSSASGRSISAMAGAIVLPAFRPDPELLTVQLASIRSQTRSDFQCLVAADGDATVERLVKESVGDDGRFQVIGFPDNRGVYLNVERALRCVPQDVGWIALSDQDDRWYPQKLERLVPHLDSVSLVSGQARVIRYPLGEVLVEHTRRQVLPSDLLTIANQVTGSFSVFRRELLDVALPFPVGQGPTTFHDHWIGVCAAATGGYSVVEEVLQDYIQHGSNLVGEFAAPPRRRLLVALHQRPRELLRENRSIADRYMGGHTLRQRLRAAALGPFGWPRAMAGTVLERVSDPPSDLVRLARWLDPTSGVTGLLRILGLVRSAPLLGQPVLDGLMPGVPHELASRLAPSRTRTRGSG